MWHSDLPDTDPLEDAVEQLAAQFGTLFISGAGDFGEFGGSVLAEPGNTDPALSVGAVDKDGQLAVFSSRGPRIGDGAIKPDLTALGVDAVGARASGVPVIGAPIDTAYQAVSTTEAAAALAAGAAALLAEQHLDWTGAELKAALTGAADPSPVLTAFEQGSGQLDIARATRQSVTASTSSLSLGLVRWPHDDDRLFERTVTYHNAGASPVHLALSAALRGPDRQPAPARMVSRGLVRRWRALDRGARPAHRRPGDRDRPASAQRGVRLAARFGERRRGQPRRTDDHPRLCARARDAANADDDTLSTPLRSHSASVVPSRVGL